MKAVDTSFEEKQQFELERTQFLPKLDKHDLVVRNPKLKELKKDEKYYSASKTINSQRLLFDPDDYFQKNKVSVFDNKAVKGGGGAMYNKAKAEAAE